MFKQMRQYGRSVAVTWLYSYLSVLLVPVLISFILYSSTLKLVENETYRSNESLLTQIEMSIDNKLKGLRQLSLEISLNKTISTFSSAETPLTDDRYYDLFHISDSLRTYKNANDYIEEIYVMYKNSDTVVSVTDHTNSRGLHAKLRPDESVSYEQWSSLFDKKYVNDYIPMKYWTDNKEMPVVVFAHSLVFNNPVQPQAIVLFLIRDTKLVESLPRKDHSDVVIVDQNGRYIASIYPDPLMPESIRYERLDGPKGLVYEQSKGVKTAFSYITSEVTGWKYISVMPASIFNEKMTHIRNLTWVSIGLCLLIGGLISLIFLRKNYMPIQVMLTGLSQRFGVRFDGASNEYAFLQGALFDNFVEKEHMTLRLKKHQNAIRTHFIHRLLKGQLEQGVPLHEASAAHDIRFQSTRFAVLLISIDSLGKFESYGSMTDVDKGTRMLHFVLTNVIEDLSMGTAEVYTAEVNDVLAYVVNFRPGLSEDEESRTLKRIADQASKFMQEHIHSQLTLAIGMVHSDINGIADSYQEALSALEHRVVLGSGHIIPFGELRARENEAQPVLHYYYPLNLEQELVYLIKSGNQPRAQAILDEVFKRNFGVNPLSIPLAKCLMFNLASTMLKTLDEVSTTGRRIVDDYAEGIERLLQCETVMEMKEGLDEELRKVCEWIQSEKKDHHKNLVEEVRTYIGEHFRDANLNISMIGDAFQMTPSYLSRLYKDHTGEALLDTINRLRLAEAKDLLSNPKNTVNEVAERVGYADVSTFMRSFKKFEGMTPGKYQKTAQQ
jgi:AraC-like DNA-binding protein